MMKLLIAGVLILVFVLCASANTTVDRETTRTQAISRTLHINAPKEGGSRYSYVHFEVPHNVSKISISYSYDHANGSNTLDIGLFDSRSNEKSGDISGFRGWSGGRRAEFFVSRESATPGYVPGEMPAGTWRIILGLYRVVPLGVDVSVKIFLEVGENKTTTLAAAPQASPSAMRLPASLSGQLVVPDANALEPGKVFHRWVTGDLHLHTVHSDGDWAITELVTAARNARLDFICFTDHNTYSHHADIDRLSSIRNEILILRGEEITTYGGHANAWGLPHNSLIDFRVTPGDRKAISRIVSQAHSYGALISINHPFALCAGCDWSYGEDANGFDALEVWNGSWDSTDERALALWDRFLQEGRRITAIGSSDSHRPANPIGQAATHVSVDGALTMAAVLKSIRLGRVYLTSEATTSLITFEGQSIADHRTHEIGEVIRLANTGRVVFKVGVSNLSGQATVSLISQGKVVRQLETDMKGKSQYVEIDVDKTTYFRIELRDRNGKMLALTNPIYVEAKRSP